MTDVSDIHLYTAQTANGIKVSIVLEELGLKYNVSPSRRNAPYRLLDLSKCGADWLTRNWPSTPSWS